MTITEAVRTIFLVSEGRFASEDPKADILEAARVVSEMTLPVFDLELRAIREDAERKDAALARGGFASLQVA